MLLGLKPVLVDVDPNTFQISIDGIKKALTHRTKAIIPVHLFGQCADMENIIQIAKERNLSVIEDSAQALGAKYQFLDSRQSFAGTMGDFGTTSFFPSKNLGCFGDGGAICTNRDDLAQMARSLINHGMKVRYYYDNVGVNSRLDTIQAAILNVKLKSLDNITCHVKPQPVFMTWLLPPATVSGFQAGIQNQPISFINIRWLQMDLTGMI